MNLGTLVALRRGLTALTAGTAILVAGAGPVAGTAPDGAYARFLFGDGGKGLVVLTYTGATTVNAGVVGLMASSEYSLRGSSQDCSHAPSQANKVFRINGMTDGDGVLWMRRSPAIGSEVHAIWLGSNDALGAAYCSLTLNFEKYKTTAVSGDWNGDGMLGIWDKEHVLSLMERRPNNRARVSIVVDGMAGDDMVNLRGVNRACGHHPTQRFFDLPAELASQGAFKSKLISITPNEMGMIRSERAVFDSSRGCANIIGILIA